MARFSWRHRNDCFAVLSSGALRSAGSRQVLVIVAIVLLSCSTSHAWNEPGGDSRDAAPVRREAITTNQSVSLETDQSGQAEQANLAVEVAPPEARPAENQPARSGENRDSVASRRTSRQIKRLGVSDINSDSTDSSPWYRTGLGALAIVLSVIGGLVWLLRKWVPSARVDDSAILKTVARTTLSPKHSAALLQLGRRFILVGVSPDSVKVLSEINEENEVADLYARLGTGGRKADTAFEDLLGQEAQTYDDESEPSDSDERRVGGGRPSVPLGDLLTRVRSLQSRWKAGSKR